MYLCSKCYEIADYLFFIFTFSTILQIGDVDVNVRDADGWTPLHAAVHWGSQTATELLTEAGADFDLKNNNVRTFIFNYLYSNCR